MRMRTVRGSRRARVLSPVHPRRGLPCYYDTCVSVCRGGIRVPSRVRAGQGRAGQGRAGHRLAAGRGGARGTRAGERARARRAAFFAAIPYGTGPAVLRAICRQGHEGEPSAPISDASAPPRTATRRPKAHTFFSPTLPHTTAFFNSPPLRDNRC